MTKRINALLVTLSVAIAAACGGGAATENQLCKVSSDCLDPNLPFCVAGACHECENSTSCSTTAPVCDPTTLACEACTTDGECSGVAMRNRCAPTGACVGCINDSQCEPTAPVCDTAAFSCRKCSADGECASGACNLDTGACVAESGILYATVDGTANTMCTRASPCSLRQSLSQVDAARATIVIADGKYVGATTPPQLGAAKSATLIGSAQVVIEAGAAVGATGILVTNDAVLEIRGVTLQSTPNTSALRCNGGSLSLQRVTGIATNAGKPVVLASEQCAFSASQSSFDDSALSAVGTVVSSFQIAFDRCKFSVRRSALMLSLEGETTITNSIFSPADENSKGAFGHTRFNARGDTITLFNNTFYETFIPLGNADFQNVVAAGYNIVFLTTVPDLEIVPGTNFAYNLVNLPLTGTPNVGNITGDPMFVDPAGGDFRVKPGSPANDKGGPGPFEAPLDRDFEGKSRPVGPASDLGAFEYGP